MHLWRAAMLKFNLGCCILCTHIRFNELSVIIVYCLLCVLVILCLYCVDLVVSFLLTYLLTYLLTFAANRRSAMLHWIVCRGHEQQQLSNCWDGRPWRSRSRKCSKSNTQPWKSSSFLWAYPDLHLTESTCPLLVTHTPKTNSINRQFSVWP